MDADPSLTLPAILDLLDAPSDGRLLAFGASSASHALKIAAKRPDLLIIVCDSTYEVTRQLSNVATAERLDNIIVGDTHAGPPVDRSLFVGAAGEVPPADLIAIRRATLPGGYAIFIEPGTDAQGTIAKLREFGYEVTDEVESPIAGHRVIRAR
jgi:hypothetical protein